MRGNSCYISSQWKRAQFEYKKRVSSINKYLIPESCSLQSRKDDYANLNYSALPQAKGTITDSYWRSENTQWIVRIVTLQSFFLNIWCWSARQTEFLRHQEISLVQFLFRHHSRKTFKEGCGGEKSFFKDDVYKEWGNFMERKLTAGQCGLMWWAN